MKTIVKGVWQQYIPKNEEGYVCHNHGDIEIKT